VKILSDKVNLSVNVIGQHFNCHKFMDLEDRWRIHRVTSSEWAGDNREAVQSGEFEHYLATSSTITRALRRIEGDELSSAELSANFPPTEGLPMIVVFDSEAAKPVAKFNSYRHAAAALKCDPSNLKDQVEKGSLKIWPVRVVTDSEEFANIAPISQDEFPTLYREAMQTQRGGWRKEQRKK
jgi:hypothetical protein